MMTTEQRRRFEERLDSLAGSYRYYVERYNQETNEKNKHEYECLYRSFESEYIGAILMVETMGLINSEESYEYQNKL